MKSMKFKPVALAVLAASLTGCSYLAEKKEGIDRSVQQTLDTNQERKTTSLEVDRRGPLIERKKGFWLGQKAVDVAKTEQVPEFLKQDVTLVFPGRTNLATAAERISKATGFHVRLRPDVFLSGASLAPASSQAGGAPAGSPALPPGAMPAMPMGTPLAASTTTLGDFDSSVELNYNGSLAGLLDRLTAKSGLNWEWKNGAIEIYRFVSRTFTIHASPGSSKYAAGISKSGGASSGITTATGAGSSSSGNFSSTSQLDISSSFSIWDDLTDSVKGMLTPMGKLTVSQSTGSLTVTDAKENVDRVAEFVERQNQIMTRQVSVRVEVFSVTQTDNSDFGIDWNAVYDRMKDGVSKWTLDTASPSSMVGTTAGITGMTLTAPAGANNTLSRMTGSQALFKALNDVGRARVMNTATASTLNRNAVPIAITNQTGYLAQTTPATSSDSSGGGGAPGLVPGTVTTGYILNVLPTITDANNVLLQFSVDISTLKRISEISSGSGATLQRIQTPEVDGVQFLQRVALKPGESVVLTGFDREVDEYNRRTLTPDAPLATGGSQTTLKRRESVVIVITPYIGERVI